MCPFKLLPLCVIVATARSRYESLKKHTQDELKHTIDAMLDTETKVKYVSLCYLFSFLSHAVVFV